MKDLIILCDGCRVEEIEEYLEQQFQHDPTISVLSSGTTERYGLGIIIIEYEQEPPANFLYALKRDTDIFDHMDAFAVPTYYEGTSEEASREHVWSILAGGLHSGWTCGHDDMVTVGTLFAKPSVDPDS